MSAQKLMSTPHKLNNETQGLDTITNTRAQCEVYIICISNPNVWQDLRLTHLTWFSRWVAVRWHLWAVHVLYQSVCDHVRAHEDSVSAVPLQPSTAGSGRHHESQSTEDCQQLCFVEYVSPLLLSSWHWGRPGIHKATWKANYKCHIYTVTSSHELLCMSHLRLSLLK